VAVDSVSSRSNLPMIELIEHVVKRLGFVAVRQEIGPGKANLVARKGSGASGGLALVGHTDTVPYDSSWTEALTLTERDGNLYGRGACDTKGFIACALAAAAQGTVGQAPLWLIFTADEEIGCLGAKALERVGTVHPAFAIVGEPTQLQPVYGGKGYCTAEVVVRGLEGHSAYPDRGASALDGARLFLDGLERLQDQLRQEGEPGFSPPFTTLNVGVLTSGKAKNIVPGEARFTVEWRPPPGQAPARVSGAFAAVAADVRRRKPKLTVHVDVQREDRGFATPIDSRLVRFLAEREKTAPTTVPFGTEAPQLIALGAETVVFGPGDIRVAHQTGEHVPIAHLTRATETLTAAIRTFTE
jgi:acetylornithine deacetylase